MRLINVPAMNLRPGMFVAELDRPWLETPFSIQGFMVRDDDDVMFVAKYVDHVLVDADYVGAPAYLELLRPKGDVKRAEKLALKADFEQAKISFQSAAESLNAVFSSLHNGHTADMSEVKQAVRPLIDGVFKNKDAIAALARLKGSGEYRYNHSIAMAVWAAILGRHIGLHKVELEKLVVGCAMCDVGMTKLPEEILEQSEPLSEAQLASVREHPRMGVELMRESKNVDLEVLMIVESHHERHDGSGYPAGLDSASTPLLARIAGIVDTYDAMISVRPHVQNRSSYDATQELIDSKNRLFQGALVEQFVQAIGLFPVSVLVELNNGEVAIVVAQNETRRLKPEVLVVLDDKKLPKSQFDLLDLAQSGEVGSEARWIARELPPGSYGINSQDFFI